MAIKVSQLAIPGNRVAGGISRTFLQLNAREARVILRTLNEMTVK